MRRKSRELSRLGPGAVAIVVAFLPLVIGGCKWFRKSPISGTKPVAEQPGTQTQAPQNSRSPAVAEALPPPPQYEAWFVESVRKYEAKYPTLRDAEKSNARDSRRLEIDHSLPGMRTLEGWTGRLRKLQLLSGGKAALSIELPDSNILVQTWGDAGSDATGATLIEQTSELYRRLSKLPIGAPALFGFEFLEDGLDYVKEGSPSTLEGMTSPKFIARFKDVKAAAK